mmetsp:Transcript_12437/g.29641  ORF Transcript_12437/g.29641 Transcript_12437/m.29641 type:complete len:537 (+) Transcript_12437:81-1691(+)
MDNHDEGLKIDVEKTYKTILAKREAKLSREALAEREATQLTKYFIRARRRELKETLEQQAKQSRRHYERNLQKVKDAGEAALAMAQMVQEEKVIISNHMAEKGRERQAEELRAKAERDERAKWQQARMLYERFQAEDRARLRQVREQEKMEKIQDSHRKHDHQLREHQVEKAEGLKNAQQKRLTDALKVKDSKQKLLHSDRQDARKTANTVQRKMREAEERRTALHKEVTHAKREQMEVVLEKVDRAERERQQRRQAKHEEILQKALELEIRLAERAREKEGDKESSEGEPSPRRQGERGKALPRGSSKESKALDDSKSQQEKKEETSAEKDEASEKACPPICYDSKELIHANNRVHKDYVRRCANLNQAGIDMLTKKQFKALADAASSKEPGQDDPYCFRMRSLHNHYIKEGKGKPTSPIRSARTPRRKVPTCGLCERHFPLESLVGSASQRMLQRLKQTESRGELLVDVLKSNSQVPGAVASPASPTMSERAADGGGVQTKAEDRMLPGVRLYDAGLPLCAACYHRVRICSSQQ